MIRDFLHLLTYAKPYWRYFLLGTIALLFVDLLDTFTPAVAWLAIDHLVYMQNTLGSEQAGNGALAPLSEVLPSSWFDASAFMGGMWVYFVLITLTVALTGVGRYWMSMEYSRGSVNLIHDLRGRFFGHVQRLAARYHDKSKIGDQMALATNDLDSCRMFYGFGLLIFFDTLFYFTLVPLYMLQISWQLLLASLITLPLIPVIVAALTKRVESRYDELQAQFAALSERCRESYAGAKVVKSFAQEQNEIKSFSKVSREYQRRGLKLAAIDALEAPALALMLGLADLVVVLYGGYLALQGHEIYTAALANGASNADAVAAVKAAGAITVGEFFAFFQYLIRLSGPMIGVGWMVTLFQRANVSMKRIEEVLATKPDIVDAEKPAAISDLRGEIELRNLAFSYYPDTPVLQGISIKVPAGRTLALVGPVGGGKSTILSIVARLYDPPPGTVFIDGVDVREIPLSVLRTRIGAVPQETFLFSETILKNIGMGGEGAKEPPPDDWLKECARLTQVEPDILAFPKQYETMLGEKGVNLSGGQKQRVAIARAIARRPAILLLDDCLSAVDTNTEAAILRGLRGVMKARTTLIVSHRISTIEHADEIVVIEGGRITERGTHEELLERKGYYADLHAKQQIEASLASS